MEKRDFKITLPHNKNLVFITAIKVINENINMLISEINEKEGYFTVSVGQAFASTDETMRISVKKININTTELCVTFYESIKKCDFMQSAINIQYIVYEVDCRLSQKIIC